MNNWGTLGWVAMVLATVGGFVWLLYRGVYLFFRARPHLRGHLFAAVLWTLVTVFQTADLLLSRNEPNVIGSAVAILAGFVMISSWAQFAERQSGATYRQEKRPFLARLLVQTVWGLCAVWGMAWGAGVAGNDWLDRALTNRDVATVKRLRTAGFVSDDMSEPGDCALAEAVRAQDEQAVRTYLAAGVSVNFIAFDNITPFESAVSRDNVNITKLLFAQGHPYPTDTPLLHRAVENGQLEQARFLLRRGANPDEIAEKTHYTALQIAKKQNNQPMIALLKSAGATK